MSNDTAAYVVVWLKKLRDDRRLRRHSVAQGRHAADYILRAPHTVENRRRLRCAGAAF
jgi:antirestriction protein ArdC